MKRNFMKLWMALGAWCLLGAGPAFSAPLGTAFSYQGRLTAGGAPAHGEFDLKLTLYDAMVGGAALGMDLTNNNVVVSNGLFTTTLDFGPGVFTGDTYWLEVAVRPGASAADFGSPLLPRHPILGTPYALHAANADQFGGFAVDAFWQLGGNTGTIPGADFVGTTDNQPLEFRVGNQRVFLLDPTASVPNVVGGTSDNEILSNAVGVGIGGGDNNDAGGDYGVIGGGRDNVISSTGDYGTIPGGRSGVAYNYGQQAFASGAFAAPGDAQTSVYVLRGSTSLAGPVQELFLDGSGERMGLPRDSAWSFDILVVASGANGSSGGFQVKGVVKRVGATTSMVGGVNPIFASAIALDGGSWAVSVRGDDATDALTVTVTGDTFQEVRWVATVRTSEIVF
jgi:hypothetical protein